MLLQAPAVPEAMSPEALRDAAAVEDFDNNIVRVRRALLIGNKDYKGKKRQVANAINDSESLAGILTASKWQKVDVVVNLNKENLRASIRAFSESINDDDVALFYYAGHGVQIEGRSYLVGNEIGAGSTPKEVEQAAFPVEDVQRYLEKSGRPGPSIIIIDACRTRDTNRGSGSLPWTMGNYDVIIDAARRDRTKERPGGSIVVFTTYPGESAGDVSYSDPKHGVFMRSLLDVYESRVQSPGDLVSLNDVFLTIKNRVRDATCETDSSPCADRIHQRIQIYDDVGRKFYNLLWLEFDAQGQVVGNKSR